KIELRDCRVTDGLREVVAGWVTRMPGKGIIPIEIVWCVSTHQSSGDDTRVRYPSSLTDAMWAILQPLLPVRDLRKGGRPRKYSDRLVLDSIFYVLRSGCQWRMLPHDLMPFDAAHRWFTTWRKDGTWDRIHDQLRDLTRIAAGKDPQPTAAVLDAQSIKSSEGGPERGFDMGKKTTGRKRHLIVDTLGLILVVMVTSAAVSDRAWGRRMLARLAAQFRSIALVWTDDRTPSNPPPHHRRTHRSVVIRLPDSL
ncbi:MAG: IS5 family transposase, partial [Pseudonocardiales bacterium]